MAKRPYFIVTDKNDEFYKELYCEFDYFTGFALSQKQKSIQSFHSVIKKYYPNCRILEVSRRSENPLGIILSAFNLKFLNIDNKEYSVENIFQSSKVFSNGQQYIDLLYKSAKEAKTDKRLKSSGTLIKFSLNGTDWDIEPKTYFYDYIYISALSRNKKICKQLLNFDTFTDIEFNPQKSFNCQARSVAIFVSLYKKGLLEYYLNDKKLFKTIYMNQIENQLSLFSV